MLPGDNELDSIIDDLMKEETGTATNFELTPVGVTVSTSAKEEEPAEEPAEETSEDTSEDAPVRRRGRPRKVHTESEAPQKPSLPDDKENATVGAFGEDLSHMNAGQRRRYWEARIAAEARKKMRLD